MRGTSSTSFAEVLRQAEAAFAADGAAPETDAQELFSVADAIDLDTVEVMIARQRR